MESAKGFYFLILLVNKDKNIGNTVQKKDVLLSQT